jgi:hypothetical protein
VRPEGAERTVRVIVDGGNPREPHASIQVELDDGRRFEGILNPGNTPSGPERLMYPDSDMADPKGASPAVQV